MKKILLSLALVFGLGTAAVAGDVDGVVTLQMQDVTQLSLGVNGDGDFDTAEFKVTAALPKTAGFDLSVAGYVGKIDSSDVTYYGIEPSATRALSDKLVLEIALPVEYVVAKGAHDALIVRPTLGATLALTDTFRAWGETTYAWETKTSTDLGATYELGFEADLNQTLSVRPSVWNAGSETRGKIELIARF